MIGVRPCLSPRIAVDKPQGIVGIAIRRGKFTPLFTIYDFFGNGQFSQFADRCLRADTEWLRSRSIARVL